MFKYLIKKYILKHVNKVLSDNEQDIVLKKNLIDTWIGRLERIMACLKKILSTLDDNKLESEEIDSSVEDIKNVIKKW